MGEYRVLPFGLSLAPRTFTKCMDAALEPLSSQGIHILNYLDVGWLGMAIDSSFMRATLPSGRVGKVLDCLNRSGWADRYQSGSANACWAGCRRPRRWSLWASFTSDRCSVGSMPTVCIHGYTDTAVFR